MLPSLFSDVSGAGLHVFIIAIISTQHAEHPPGTLGLSARPVGSNGAWPWLRDKLRKETAPHCSWSFSLLQSPIMLPFDGAPPRSFRCSGCGQCQPWCSRCHLCHACWWCCVQQAMLHINGAMANEEEMMEELYAPPRPDPVPAVPAAVAPRGSAALRASPYSEASDHRGCSWRVVVGLMVDASTQTDWSCLTRSEPSSSSGAPVSETRSGNCKRKREEM